MHKFGYKSNGDAIRSVVEVVMKQLVSNLRKLKIMTMSATQYISSLFDLYSNPCNYLETTLSNLSYSKISVPLHSHNLSKSTELSCLNQKMHFSSHEYVYSFSIFKDT